ncbi:MAG: CARDB domain-containing protein [Chitinophagales bacterium]
MKTFAAFIRNSFTIIVLFSLIFASLSTFAQDEIGKPQIPPYKNVFEKDKYKLKIPSNKGTIKPPVQNSRPDLVIEKITINPLVCYATTNPEPLNIEVTIRNRSRTSKALGTNDEPQEGYMIDIIFSTDQSAPVQYAILPQPYNFQEDMLAIGGRISNTSTLLPGESATYKLTTRVPTVDRRICANGYMYVGAVADSGQKIAEMNEANNTGFQVFRVYCK